MIFFPLPLRNADTKSPLKTTRQPPEKKSISISQTKREREKVLLPEIFRLFVENGEAETVELMVFISEFVTYI